MDKFRNKYRIPSARLQNWDYGSNGAYFITICTKNRVHYFGEIVDGEMKLNDMGKLAEQYWLSIPQQFSFVELGNFVVMPNHTHGILIIDKNDNETNSNANVDTDVDVDANVDIKTRLIASRPSQPEKTGGFAGNKNPMLHNNISRIIRWYKGRCAFEIRKIHAGFEWLPRFHDHIIRHAESFETIQNYIVNNPINWKEDKFHI
jgi:putative transposase